MIVAMAVLAIAISLFLLYGGLIVPDTPWYLQPLFQGAVAAGIAILILLSAQGRARAHGLTLTGVATNLPLE
jgi:ABC-type Fe3+-siderophore transport system permease subunit